MLVPSLVNSPLDLNLGDNMRVNGEQYDEGGVGITEESVDSVENTEHLPLLHTIQTINNNNQSRLLTRECVQHLHHLHQQVHLFLHSLQVTCVNKVYI